MSIKLVPPCSYQGGKQRLAKKIVDIIFEQNDIDVNTKFYDLCCGSGAISLELINRGIHPNNITMVDKSDYGLFWNCVANNEFDITTFENLVNTVPDKPYRKQYLLEMSKNLIEDIKEYQYLLLQSGSFGGKAIHSEGTTWKHHGFRDYWMPTETSVRRSPCNPTQPEPTVMLSRVKDIVDVCGGSLRCIHGDVLDFIKSEVFDENSIVYIDPPYIDTTGYHANLDILDVVSRIPKHIPVYVSEYVKLSDNFVPICKGKSKGNITGIVKNTRKTELLNIFNIKLGGK